MKILFVLKEREQNGEYQGGFSSGLSNSVEFINHMLCKNDIQSKVVEVVDGNKIDREVFLYRPTHVMIEALWVTPEKLVELKKLHKNVEFIVRLHSEIPFISNEGIAMDYIFRYLKEGITVAANSKRIKEILERLTQKKIVYLPNYYPTAISLEKPYNNRMVLDIACFGAIRPLKNQLLQAQAAIIYCLENRKRLRFHINSTRVEGRGDAILKNIRNLFENYKHKGFELIEHEWITHKQFLKLIDKMDLLLQLSYSETFNIITADAVNEMTPVVVSPEVSWIPKRYQADPNDINSIIGTMKIVFNDHKQALYRNIEALGKYNKESIDQWLWFVKNF